MSDILSKVINDEGDARANARGGYLQAPQVNTFLDYMWDKTVPVSYTHLTLPTILLV